MENSDFRALLTKLDGELSEKDLEKLIFLCDELLNTATQRSIQSGHQLFEALEKKKLISCDNLRLIAILLKEIGRMDIYDQLPSSSAFESDDSQQYSECVNPFNHVLLQISEEIPKKELERLRYAYGDAPGNADISSALDLFKIMKQQQHLCPSYLDRLMNLLELIQRMDLLKLLKTFSYENQHLSEAATAMESQKASNGHIGASKYM